MASDPFDYRGRRALLATMHGKEQAIAPVVRDGLGLIVDVPHAFDTDRFGTFSREIVRKGSQLDAARAKIAAVFDGTPSATIALASEGSFGADPYIRMLPIGREIVVLKDRETGLELIGFHADPETNYRHEAVSDRRGADAFAAKIGFPGHGLIAMGCRCGEPAPDLALIKNIGTQKELIAAVDHVIGLCGSVFLETDMRAHRNPTRMQAIARATRDLVRRFQGRCPGCSYPGYDVTERVSGLRCGCCGLPTHAAQFEVLSCRSCGRREERPVAGRETADPADCANCNP
jgi:hypothetical protein